MSEKNKEKSSTKIFIAVVLLIIFVITIFVVIKTISTAKESENKISTKYETIMNFDYVNNYPTTPDKVMDDYCYIMGYLYSDEIKDEEIPAVVKKSRELLHFKTIESTTEDEQIRAVMTERNTISQTKSFVTNVSHGKVAIDTQFPNYAECTVTEFTKSDNNLLGDYTLQMDDYKWKVYSWTLKGTSTKDGGK